MSAFDLLASERIWLAWRGESRGDKITKVPYYTTGRKASATNPDTCSGAQSKCGGRAIKGTFRRTIGENIGDHERTLAETERTVGETDARSRKTNAHYLRPGAHSTK